MEIIYKPNKKKLTASLVLYSLFIAVGLFIIKKSDLLASYNFVQKLGIFGTTKSLQIIGIFSVIVLVLMIIGIIYLFFQNYVLKINENGFVNNTNSTNVGLILWKDVIDISLKKKDLNSFIFIYVNNKNEYYKRVKNPLIKINTIIYNKFYGASFVIETLHLPMLEEELFEILKKYAKL